MRIQKCFVFTVDDLNDCNDDIYVFSFNQKGYKYACEYLLDYAKNYLDEDEYNRAGWYNSTNWSYDILTPPDYNEFVDGERSHACFALEDNVYFSISVEKMTVFQENLDIE